MSVSPVRQSFNDHPIEQVFQVVEARFADPLIDLTVLGTAALQPQSPHVTKPARQRQMSHVPRRGVWRTPFLSDTDVFIDHDSGCDPGRSPNAPTDHLANAQPPLAAANPIRPAPPLTPRSSPGRHARSRLAPTSAATSPAQERSCMSSPPAQPNNEP